MYEKRIENEPYSPSREEERNTESDVKKIHSLNVILLILFFGLLASLRTINKLFFQSTPYPELILILAECAVILLSFLTVIRVEEWYEKGGGK
jgi:glucan phosphoethanolaminetransferase (alkaline phosphatase superfamily)